jgi:hypothetical protein
MLITERKRIVLRSRWKDFAQGNRIICKNEQMFTYVASHKETKLSGAHTSTTLIYNMETVSMVCKSPCHLSMAYLLVMDGDDGIQTQG